ncbi:hypothetical protein C1X64_21595 [Pseudomonas sp. GW456-E7]|nr:hypothetical protein C1X64_21595 [Pseudomonas sp. GW456-E7]
MFRTYDWAEAISVPFFEDDFRVWTYVEYDVGGVWFHVQIEERECTRWRRFNLMISGEFALRSLIARQSEHLAVVDVQLVSSSEVNNSGRLLMKSLVKAERLFHKSKNGILYEVDSGKCYPVGDPTIDPARSDGYDLIFDSSMCLDSQFFDHKK